MLIIITSVVLAAGGALWLGLQQDQGETSTTYVFGSRVGFDAPLVDLEDHIADIVNSVEFPAVFQRIEDRTLLEEDAYELTIGILENTQSVVSIEIRTDQSGEADRIARIVAEEMVRFVLEGVDTTIVTELELVEEDVANLTIDQIRLEQLAGGIAPPVAERSIEGQLAAMRLDAEGPVGTLEGELLADLRTLSPLADQYEQNQLLLGDLQGQAASLLIQRSELDGAMNSVSAEWYRSITPIEPTSNVPVAIAMAFAAGFPAFLASTVLVLLNISRRLAIHEQVETSSNKRRVATA